MFEEFYEEQRRKKKRKKKANKRYAKERDDNFVKLLEDQQILHIAECDPRYALYLIKTYKKQYLNYPLMDEIEAIWEDQSLTKDQKLYLGIILIFSFEHYEKRRRDAKQGIFPESAVGLNEKSRFIMETLMTTALELPYRIWPYWKNINDLTLSPFFSHWGQKFAEGNNEFIFRRACGTLPKPAPPYILKSAEELGAKPLPREKPKKEKVYWVELKHEISFPDDLGQKVPAKNAPYILTLPDGHTVEGKLDNQGKARHNNLKIAGRCTVDYEPTIDDEIKQLQENIKKELDKLVEIERNETLKIQKEYDDSNWVEKRFKDTKAAASGLWNLIAGFFGTLWDIYQSIGDIIYSASSKANLYVLAPYHAPETFKKDIKALKEKYQAFRQFTDEDLAIYFLFIKDKKTSQIFFQFAEDYLEAQHYSEYIEGGSEAVFGVVFTVLTAGAGGAATAGAAGARITSTANKLAPLVKSLAKLLKRRRGRKRHSGDTNSRLESKNTQKLNRADREKLASKRPARYRKGVVEDVWENAKGPDGKVRDPNTREVLKWDKSRNRDGQWDMGHIKNKPYDKLKKKFIDGKISRKEFLDQYNNPKNYYPQARSANRSRKYD